MKVKKSFTTLTIILSLAFALSSIPVSAMTYQDEVNVQFTFEPSLSISLSSPNLIISNLVPGNYSNSNTITVDVTTNNVAGYTLTAKVGGTGQTAANNSLVNTISNTAFTSLGDSDNIILPNFSDNKWGFSTAASITDATTFSGLLYNEDKVINATTNYTGTAATGYTGTNSTKFTIGAKASADQAAGDYTNVITFTAVTNATPINIQDFTASECQTLASDADYIVYDARDGNDYTVRYIEGACWMTQNLRITGTVSSEYSNFSTYDNVNVCEGDVRYGASWDEPRCYDSGDITSGVWYNYAAASAKTITGSSNTTLATEDICPANWHLPSYDTNGTAGSINSLSSTSSTSALKFSPVSGGNWVWGSLSNTSNGYWWATTVSGIYGRYLLDYTGTHLGTTGYDRNNGSYIRCVSL